MSISRLTSSSSTIIRKTKLQRSKETTVEISKPSSSALLDQKIDEITASLSACYGNNLRLLLNQQDISVIIEYIQAMKTEINPSDHYRKNTIEALTKLSNLTRINHSKIFHAMI